MLLLLPTSGPVNGASCRTEVAAVDNHEVMNVVLSAICGGGGDAVALLLEKDICGFCGSGMAMRLSRSSMNRFVFFRR